MVPDIALQKRKQHANSIDSSATPSPLTDSVSNSPATPSFSPTPSPESRSSSVSSHFSSNSSSYNQYNRSNSPNVNGTANGRSHQYPYNGNSRPLPNVGQMNGGPANGGQINGHRNGIPSKPHLSLTSAPITPNQLPINLVKNQLLKNIQQNESIIIIGETGCGKTTQIPKFIYEFYGSRQYQNPLVNYGNVPRQPFSGLIGITQPRRVAATSISTRVAQEMNSQLGQLVGYTIRFEDCTSAATRIKYMTDGILLREAISDPLLSKYRVIILDEAHERTVHTDVLFGVVKKAQRLRKSKRTLESDSSAVSNGNSEKGAPQAKPLKLIIMSATMDVDHFSRYFNNAPVYYIVGRTFPIEIFYTQEKQSDYVSSALSTIFQIHQQEDELEEDNHSNYNSNSIMNGYAKKKPIGGDIIVFCTGQEEIESMIKTVEDLSQTLNAFKTRTGHPKTLKAYPLYAALPSGLQQKIFSRTQEDCFRRVIFATNIAETSVTIPNIRYVVDTGKVKSRIFSPKTGFEVMQVEDVSRAQACQRSGRAGRLAPGQCYRLYTKRDFKKMKPFAIPEIQKCNLSNVLLQLMAIGIRDVANFDFVDQPAKENMDVSLESLLSMKAIKKVRPSETVATDNSSAPSSSPDLYQLTEIGRQMVSFPVDPRYAALIIASKSFRCTDEILIIISMLSVDSVFYVPASDREQALKMHKKFHSSEGDLIKLLNVYRRFKEAKQSREWCNENFLRPVQLKMAVEIRTQLAEQCFKGSIPVVACNNTEQVRRCLAVGVGVGVGLGANVAVLQREGDYRLLNLSNRKSDFDSSSRSVFIHPSSCLFGGTARPECVLFVEHVHTTKSYLRNVCTIDQQWLMDYKDQTPAHTEPGSSQVNAKSNTTI